MKKAGSIFLFMFIAIFCQAQKDVTEKFTKLNVLLANAVGQQYNIEGTSTPCFVGEQVFSEAVIESRTRINESEWISRYQKMQWTGFNDYSFETVEGNENLLKCRVEFKVTVDWVYYKNGNKKAKATQSPHTEFYFLSKDRAQADRLLTLIGLHFF